MCAMGQQWDIKTTHASRSTPMMTAAGIHHYQTFSQPCTTKERLQQHLADSCLTSLCFLTPWLRQNKSTSTIAIIWKQQGQINCIGVLHDFN